MNNFIVTQLPVKSRGAAWPGLKLTVRENKYTVGPQKLTEKSEDITRDRREIRESRANSWSNVNTP
jgi:hypothetical protein